MRTSSFFGIDWSGLQYFLMVARVGSAASAARQLNLDQVTVARHISTLEAALQTRLFDRGPRGYELTSAGIEMMNIAESIEGLASGAYSRLASQDSQLKGVLRIAAPEGLTNFFLPDHLGRFGTMHPQVRMQLVPMARLHSVSKREADIAITVGNVLGGRAVAKRLGDFTLGLYASEDYLASRPPITSPHDLSKHRLIGYIEDQVVMPELQYFKEIDSRLTASFQTSSLTSRMMLATSGAGLVVVPHFMAASQPKLHSVLFEEIAIRRSYWTVYREDMRRVARMRAFIDFLVETIDKNRHILAPQQPARTDDPTRP